MFMNKEFILTGYIEAAMNSAEYGLFDDNSFSGRIPACKGVIAFGKTLAETNQNLRSTLEDWVLLGLKLGHCLPVIDGIDLTPKNRETKYESV
jgi:predicted RNase H-like HicB family nuclease